MTMTKTKRHLIVSVAVMLVVLPSRVSAIPTFQAYVQGGTAQSQGMDEASWMLTASSFDLSIVGAYGRNDISVESVTLLFSVPKGQMGTISITSLTDGNPAIVMGIGDVSMSPVLNPKTAANIDVLTNNAGLDGYDSKDFLPAGDFSDHFPFQESVSDFVLFDLGMFDKSDAGSLMNYNAEDGIIESVNAEGEQKEYQVSFTGFSEVHIDVYGVVISQTRLGKEMEIRTTWDINPASHDSTVTRPVPAPGAAVLGLLGLGVVGYFRKRVGQRPITV